MRVVCFMASETGRRRCTECPVLMAVQARRLLMFATQGKVSRIVIELRVHPFSGFVTGGAVVIHRIFMRLVIEMTADAIGLRVAMFLVLHMTISTLGFQVCAKQFEIRELVLEGVLVEYDYFGVSSFVICVA